MINRRDQVGHWLLLIHWSFWFVHWLFISYATTFIILATRVPHLGQYAAAVGSGARQFGLTHCRVTVIGLGSRIVGRRCASRERNRSASIARVWTLDSMIYRRCAPAASSTGH